LIKQPENLLRPFCILVLTIQKRTISGGGVRIGLEDNIWFDNDRQQLATNYKLVERLTVIAKSLGLQPYRPAELRKLLNLKTVE
jgi:uncharacterized protein (DUF849 family)